MNNQSKSVGAYIRELRTSKRIPLRKLASILDIDTSTLAKMEKDQRPFSLDMAPAIAKALELDFKELQIALLASVVLQAHGTEEFAKEGLKRAVRQLDKMEVNSK